jgi:hypothetical protein
MSISLRKALNQLVLPMFIEKGFTGKFPLIVRQRTELSDTIALQCDRYGRGMIVLHLRCFEAVSSPVDLHRYGKALDVEAVRGSTVSLRLFGPVRAYWLNYTVGEELSFAEKMKLWIPAIENWFKTGQWDQQLLPEAFLPKLEKDGLFSRLIRSLKKINQFSEP